MKYFLASLFFMATSVFGENQLKFEGCYWSIPNDSEINLMGTGGLQFSYPNFVLHPKWIEIKQRPSGAWDGFCDERQDLICFKEVVFAKKTENPIKLYFTVSSDLRTRINFLGFELYELSALLSKGCNRSIKIIR